MLSIILSIAATRCANPFNTTRAPQQMSSKSHAPIVVTLCAVVENPAQYDGKRVTLSGCVTTDGLEYVVLSDLKKPCPRGGIVPVNAPALRREQQFDAEAGKKVCGTFTGTFRASNALYQRVLEVEETSGLTTTPLME